MNEPSPSPLPPRNTTRPELIPRIINNLFHSLPITFLLLERFYKFHNILLTLQESSEFLRVYVGNGTSIHSDRSGNLYGFTAPHGKPNFYQEEKTKIPSDDGSSDY